MEKQRSQLKAELDDARTQLEHVSKGKTSADKLVKQLESQLAEAADKLDDAQRKTQEVESSKSRLLSENNELTRQLEEAESQVRGGIGGVCACVRGYGCEMGWVDVLNRHTGKVKRIERVRCELREGARRTGLSGRARPAKSNNLQGRDRDPLS